MSSMCLDHGDCSHAPCSLPSASDSNPKEGAKVMLLKCDAHSSRPTSNTWTRSEAFESLRLAYLRLTRLVEQLVVGREDLSCRVPDTVRAFSDAV